MPFSSQREAKRFLVEKIAREAGIEGNPLTEIDKRLLLFSEQEPDTATGLAEDHSAEFDVKYEKRMIRLLRAAYRRDRNEPSARLVYRDAMRRLREGDHYILVMAESALPREHLVRDLILYVAIGLALVAMVVGLAIWDAGR